MVRLLPPIIVSEDEGEGEGEETSGEAESMLVEDPSNLLLAGEKGKEKEEEEEVADSGIAIKLDGRARAESFSQKARIGDDVGGEEDEVSNSSYFLMYYDCDCILIDYLLSL